MEEWRAYDLVEPIPDPQWIGAQICQVIANANRGKHTRPFKVDDFIPRRRRRRGPSDVDRPDPERVRALFVGLS